MISNLIREMAGREEQLCAAGAWPTLRVLVVDDNVLNRQLMTIVLDMLRAQLHYAFDGLEALRACESQSFDVILMDLNMPVMDGVEATLAIRALDARLGRPRTPIVMVSTDCGAATVKRAMAAGVDDYLPKPIDVAAILAKVSLIAEDRFSRKLRPRPAE